MAELTPLYMDVDDAYSGDELALPYRDFISEGVVGSGDLAVTERGAGVDLSVDVAAGAAWVLGDTNSSAQPCYRVRNDAVVNLGISPDPSNPRKVLVVAQITDETFSGTGRDWELVAIHGTPAAVPTEPALPDSALELALIDVTAADASIADSQITDRRTLAGLGGNFGSMGSYTPTWTSTGTPPSLGSGVAAGLYQKMGSLVWVHAAIAFAGDTTFGTGTYAIGLPPGLPVVAATQLIGLSAMSVDFGTAEYLTFGFAGPNTTSMTGKDAGNVYLTPTTPFTWGANDTLRLAALYQTSA